MTIETYAYIVAIIGLAFLGLKALEMDVLLGSFMIVIAAFSALYMLIKKS